MDSFESFKVLLENPEVKAKVENLLREINEKKAQVEELKRKKDVSEVEIGFLTTQLYTLAAMKQEAAFRIDHDAELFKQMKKIFAGTSLINSLLDQVEWHKIHEYNDLSNLKLKEQLEEINLNAKKNFEEMENRDCVMKLRSIHSKYTCLQEKQEILKKAKSKHQKDLTMKFETAIQKRNSLIVDFVKHFMKLDELNLELENKEENELVPAVPLSLPIQQVLYSEAENPAEFQTAVLQDQSPMTNTTEDHQKITPTTSKNDCQSNNELKNQDINDNSKLLDIEEKQPLIQNISSDTLNKTELLNDFAMDFLKYLQTKFQKTNELNACKQLEPEKEDHLNMNSVIKDSVKESTQTMEAYENQIENSDSVEMPTDNVEENLNDVNNTGDDDEVQTQQENLGINTTPTLKSLVLNNGSKLSENEISADDDDFFPVSNDDKENKKPDFLFSVEPASHLTSDNFIGQDFEMSNMRNDDFDL